MRDYIASLNFSAHATVVKVLFSVAGKSWTIKAMCLHGFGLRRFYNLLSFLFLFNVGCGFVDGQGCLAHVVWYIRHQANFSRWISMEVYFHITSEKSNSTEQYSRLRARATGGQFM